MRSRIHILFISILFLTLVSAVRAATFVVDRADDPQAVPDACTAAPNDCSLRGAMFNANANGDGGDTINFNIPGGGVKTIVLIDRLPEIHSSLIVNGATQAGYGGKPVIELRGDGAEFGLDIGSETDISVTAIALALNNFTGHGVGLECAARCDLTLLGNFIGVDPTGAIDKGNWHDGVYVKPSANAVIKIGGTGAFEGNVISGNLDAGVHIVANSAQSGSAQVAILGNKIGTNYGGTSKIPNHQSGIEAYESALKIALTVGGATAAARNLISGNDEFGVRTNGSDVKILGNYIGTNSAGNAALGNEFSGVGLFAEDSSVVKIGGAATGEGNVISGNKKSGVEIFKGSTDSSGAQIFVRGNFIGTNAAGTSDVGNLLHGIEVASEDNQAAQITIGGTAAERNVISGNDRSGIRIGSGDVRLYGNFIGTDAAGASALGNTKSGVEVYIPAGKTASVKIGGTLVANNLSHDGGNVISGNGENGINLFSEDDQFSSVVIRRNRIGTNPDGTNAVPNSHDGIYDAMRGVVIGSETSAADGNVISGNLASGIEVDGTLGYNGSAARIVGNKIGTNMLGGGSLPNRENGVYIYGAPNNQIGLAGNDTARNIISGNLQDGIFLQHESSSGNKIENNYIGAGVIGNDLGNGDSGVTVALGTENFIGSASGAGNTIAFNKRGIYFYSGANNEARRNRIFSNDELGIDIETTGVTPNDPNDTDGGANHRQNFPVLSVVNPNNIAGTLNSAPNTSYELDFYRVDSCDASGYGEGRDFLGSKTVTTDGAGNASFNQLIFLSLGETVTATATVAGADAGDTSEFSKCRQVTPLSGAALSSAAYTASEGAASRTIVVNRTGGSDGTLTVDFATSDGTATAGQDYTPVSGTLTFNGGEVVKTFNIPIIDDAQHEPDETVNISLTNATGGFLNAPSAAVLTIADNDDSPTISVSDVSAIEGSGSDTGFTFHVTLSNASSLPVTVDFATADGTANLTDYVGLSGQIHFAAGEVSKPLTVSVVGDTAPEASETFFVNLSNPSNAALADNQGTGTILDDDAAYSITGTIAKQDATPLAGAAVQLSGNQAAQTTTDANGRYSFQNLPAGGSYTITPSASNFSFNPVARQYSNLAARVDDADFTAVNAAPRQVQLIGAVTTPGQNATVTTELAARGDEYSVHFSLSYDPTILSDPQIALLPDSQSSTIWTDVSIPGEIGIMLVRPVNRPYPAGIRQLVSVTFQTAPTNAASTPITFTDTPTDRAVYDLNANPLPANYVDSLIGFLPGGYEADVSPRPTGSGNGTITVADVTQLGRFAAGLDAVNQNVNEFQRADSAPRASLGDGALTVADFTQAGRYAAGLDAVQTAGGAMQANLLEFDDSGKLIAGSRAALDKASVLQNLVPTAVRVVNAQAAPAGQVTLSIAADATGVENGFGFTLGFDASKLGNPLIVKGADTQSATLITNTGAAGKIGVVLALPAGQSLPAGTRQILTIQFTVAANAAAGPTPLTFGDAPVLREVSDMNSGVVQSSFQDGAINILGPTAGEVTIGGRVRDTRGKGLVNIFVTLTDNSGRTRTTKSNAFGYYRFSDVTVGETYVLTASGKKYIFADPTRVVTVQDEMNDLDFVGEN